MAQRIALVLAAVACVLFSGAGSVRGAVDAGSVGKLTQQVRRSISAPGGRLDDSVLVALRQLRDQRLRPLFAEMATREAAIARLHGIFGLADLSEDGKVNIVQIAGLDSKELRARALGAAISADYLTPDQMHQVLSWPELDPSVELLVMSKLRRAGEEPSVDRLRDIIAACAENEVASKLFALLMIAQAEGDSNAQEAQSILASLADTEREGMVGFALAQVLIDKLDALKGFVNAEYEWSKTREAPALRLKALAALLEVDPQRGLSEWRAAFDGTESLSERIRLSLILLSAVDRVDASAFDPLVGSEVTLLDLMGRAGRAVATHEGEGQALGNLMRQNHEQSLAWAFDTLDKMDESERMTVLRTIMDDSLAMREPGAGVPAYLYETARTLEATEPGALAPYLTRAAAEADAPLCEAYLAAAMESPPHALWEAGQQPAWPSRRCRALAAIAEARAGRQLDEDELDRLVSVGLGGQGLPAGFQVQAAWLALCQLQKEREALAEVLAPSDE